MTLEEQIAAMKQAQWRLEHAAELLGSIRIADATPTLWSIHEQCIASARALEVLTNAMVPL